MANWQEINLDFTLELQKKWEEKGFDYGSTKKWIDAGYGVNDYDFIEYLKETNVINTEILGYICKEKLREGYDYYLESKDKIKFNALGNWESPENIISQKLYLDEQIVNQIKNFEHSFNPVFYKLTSDQRLLVEQLIKNEELKERYYSWGLCKDCYQPNTGRNWCRICNYRHLESFFWTSGNIIIDNCIRKYQLGANSWEMMLEWIPYEKFTDIEYLARGGFGEVYRAKWIDGPIESWNSENGRWERRKIYPNDSVVLKSLNNSQNITDKFLQEVTFHKLTEIVNDYIVPLFGISQDPKSKNWLMVTNYINKGNMRQFLKNNRLDIGDKIRKLHTFSWALESIHRNKLIHCDLHPGNILSDNDSFFITDLGLCKPASELDEKKIYGALPYVAPEVLWEKKYTQASDIYSFGMIAYEIISGATPYQNLVHDKNLAKKIGEGLRPNLSNLMVPQLLKRLIEDCWDANSSKRLTSAEIERILRFWLDELKEKKGGFEFHKQYQEIKKQEEELNEKETFELVKKMFLLTNETMDKPLPAYQRHSLSLFVSNLITDGSENFPQPQNNYSQEWQTTTLLELQIKGVECEINLLKDDLNNEQKALINKFTNIKKQSLKNQDNQDLENEAWILEDKLEEILSREKIDSLIRHCENLVKLEQKPNSEKEKNFQANIEIPTNK